MLSFLRRNIVSDEDEADDVDDYEKMGILLDAEEITNKFYSNAVIANYFPIIFAVAQAVNGSERSRKALEKDLPEIEMVSPELQKSIWKIIDGSRKRKDIVAGLDQVSRTVVKEILEILSYQGL